MSSVLMNMYKIKCRINLRDFFFQSTLGIFGIEYSFAVDYIVKATMCMVSNCLFYWINPEAEWLLWRTNTMKVSCNREEFRVSLSVVPTLLTMKYFTVYIRNLIATCFYRDPITSTSIWRRVERNYLPSPCLYLNCRPLSLANWAMAITC